MEGLQMEITDREKEVFNSPLMDQIMGQLTSIVAMNTDKDGYTQVQMAIDSCYNNMKYPYFEYIKKMRYKIDMASNYDHFLAIQYLISAVPIIEDTTEFKCMMEKDARVASDWTEAKVEIRKLQNKVKKWGFQKDTTTRVTWAAFEQTGEKMDGEVGRSDALKPFIESAITKVENTWQTMFKEYQKVQGVLSRVTHPLDNFQIEFVKNMLWEVFDNYGDFLALTVNVKTGAMWRYIKKGHRCYVKEGTGGVYEQVVALSKQEKNHMTMIWSSQKMGSSKPYKRPKTKTKPSYDRFEGLAEHMEGSSI